MTCSGIYTALISPFDPAGALDTEGLRLLVRKQCVAGIHGLVVLGTTGEAPTLTSDERDLIVSIAREESGSLPLVAGCGAYSTAQTIDNIQRAADHGADTALVITPFYNKPTQEGLLRHYEAISRVSPLPVIIYNNPNRTGVNVDINTLERIAELPGVIGVKETAGSPAHYADILYTIKQKRPDFSVIAGDDNMTFPLLALGGDGVICGISNLFPEMVLSFYHTFRSGHFSEAQQFHLALTPLFKALQVETNPIPLKALMQLAGLPSGPPRLPLTPLNPRYKATLEEVLKHISVNPLST